MGRSLKIFRIFGIDIELHYSWFFVFLLLAWGLSSDFFPNYYPDLKSAEYWSMGIISSLLLFISVLIHEMSHSLTAKRNKIPVDKITLFFFGGVASIGSEENMTPGKEFRMAIAGPLASLVLAGIFFIINKQSLIVYIEATTYYLYRLNFILALFNMVPGYPLDGGRVLRSIIWKITKDIKKATSIASKGGKTVAITMILFGFFGTLIGAGTLWFVILGFFLYFIAGASYEQIIIKEALSKLKVKEIMIKEVKTISPEISLAKVFEDYFLRYGIEGIMVTKDKVFLGIVTMDSLKPVSKSKWAGTKVKDVMIPASKVPIAKEDEYGFDILTRMSKENSAVMPVIKNKRIIGAVSASSLLRYAQLRSD